MDRGTPASKRGQESARQGKIRGRSRTVTSSGDSGAHERRLRHGEDAGRRRWFSSYARNAPVSADQTNQRGRRQTKGRSRWRVIGRSLLGQRTWRGVLQRPDFGKRWRSYLVARAG